MTGTHIPLVHILEVERLLARRGDRDAIPDEYGLTRVVVRFGDGPSSNDTSIARVMDERLRRVVFDDGGILQNRDYGEVSLMFDDAGHLDAVSLEGGI